MAQPLTGFDILVGLYFSLQSLLPPPYIPRPKRKCSKIHISQYNSQYLRLDHILILLTLMRMSLLALLPSWEEPQRTAHLEIIRR